MFAIFVYIAEAIRPEVHNYISLRDTACPCGKPVVPAPSERKLILTAKVSTCDNIPCAEFDVPGARVHSPMPQDGISKLIYSILNFPTVAAGSDVNGSISSNYDRCKPNSLVICALNTG